MLHFLLGDKQQHSRGGWERYNWPSRVSDNESTLGEHNIYAAGGGGRFGDMHFFAERGVVGKSYISTAIPVRVITGLHIIAQGQWIYSRPQSHLSPLAGGAFAQGKSGSGKGI